MLIPIAITLAAVVFMALLLITTFRFVTPAIVANDFTPMACKWHEAKLNGCQQGFASLPQQPVNTYSNLVYLAAGLFPALVIQTPTSFAFAITMTYLCVGSSLYHATCTRWAGMHDVVAIYVVYSALAVYSLAALIELQDWIAAILMLILSGIFGLLLSTRYHRRMELKIAMFLAPAFLFELIHMWTTGHWIAWKWLVGSLICFAVAYLFWNLDVAENFPLKRWGHGLWHLLTGAATGMLFYGVYMTT